MELKKLTDSKLMEQIKTTTFWVWFNFTFCFAYLFIGLFSIPTYLKYGIFEIIIFPLILFFMMLYHLILTVGFGIEKKILINRLENRENTKLLGFNIIQKMDRMEWRK